MPSQKDGLTVSRQVGKKGALAAMGVAAAGVAVTALGDAALLDVAVSGALLAGAAAFMPGSASSKALKAKGARTRCDTAHCADVICCTPFSSATDLHLVRWARPALRFPAQRLQKSCVVTAQSSDSRLSDTRVNTGCAHHYSRPRAQAPQGRR